MNKLDDALRKVQMRKEQAAAE
jgi:hypothetical protein